MPLTISVLENADAQAALANERFRAEWAALFAVCPWASEYQSPAFLTVWFRVFQKRYEPLGLAGRAADGTLVGLLWLARDLQANAYICAGAGQAEYHGWLARPEIQDEFADAAFGAYCARKDASRLDFKLMPGDLPLSWTQDRPRWVSLTLKDAETRPLIETTPDGSTKKPNKTDRKKLGTLKKLGDLEFVRIRTGDALLRFWTQFSAQYDKRIASVCDASAYAENPEYGEFYAACMTEQPGLTEGFALTIDGRLAAGLIAQKCRDSLAIIVLTFDDTLSQHSPARQLIFMAADAAGRDGYRFLDLTPYGDWKHAMATSTLPVTSLTLFPHRGAALGEQARRMGKRLVKQGLAVMGVDYKQIVHERLKRLRA